MKALILFVMVAAVSCNVDETTVYELWVKNEMGSSVTVTAYYQRQGQLRTDTFLLTPGTSVKVTNFERLGVSRNVYENDEEITVLDSIILEKSDGTKSTKNFALAGEWNFQKKSTHSAVYTLIVDQDDF